MANLEVPHVNVLSKVDLLSKSSRKQIDIFLHPDTRELTTAARMNAGGKYAKLTEALGKVLEDYSLVRFHPLDITDEDNITLLLQSIDNTIQFGEDQEVRTESLEDLSNLPNEDNVND
jgi:hypothetical protein